MTGLPHDPPAYIQKGDSVSGGVNGSSDGDLNKTSVEQHANDLFLLSLIPVPISTAEIIYIAPNGHDVNGDGTQVNPFASLKKAIDVFQGRAILSSGSLTIQAADGIYTCYEPVNVQKFTQFRLLGNLTDHSLVTFNFDLSAFPAARPHDLKVRSACFQVSASKVEFDGFTTRLVADSMDIPSSYENFCLQRSDGVFGNLNMINEFHNGIAITQASSFGVIKDKTLFGTIKSGLGFGLSSYGGGHENGHLNLTAFNSGSGTGTSTDSSSNFIESAFQSVTLTNFANSTAAAGIITKAIEAVGSGVHTNFGYFDIDPAKNYSCSYFIEKMHASPNFEMVLCQGDLTIRGGFYLTGGSASYKDAVTFNNHLLNSGAGIHLVDQSFGYLYLSRSSNRLYASASGENRLHVYMNLKEI